MMTKAKKKQLFIISSVIGSIIILGIFIWSMRINLLNLEDTQSNEPSTDNIVDLDTNSIDNTETEAVSEEPNTNNEVNDILNTVDKDINNTENLNNQSE